LAALRDGEVRTSVVKGLADLSRGGRKTLAAAWPFLDDGVRRRATREMSRLAQERVELNFGRALRVALDDESPVVRRLAVAGLWEDEGSDLRDRLQAMATDDPALEVRSEAIAGLYRFARQTALGDAEDAVELRNVLLKLASSGAQPPAVRRRALESLAPLGGEQIAALIDEAYASEEPELRISAVVAMGRTMQSGWLETLTGELDSDDPELRREAARAIGEIGDPRVVHELARSGRDPSAEVRQAVIESLGRIGGQAATKALRGLEHGANADDQGAIEAALSEAVDIPLPF
jgi:HEAT repeat protein